MKLVRYLESVSLLKSYKEKQANGSNVKTYTKIKDYNVVKRTLDDEVNATIYGANINKMYSISTPIGDLEKYLMPKVDNIEDNISMYFIKIGGSKYKIVSVLNNELKIERL